MSETMQRIVLAARPVGAPKDSDFRLEEAPMPTPGDGEILCRTIFMSLDPYMRGRMDDRKSYATPVPLGGVMEGGTVSEVIASHNANFAVGDIVERYRMVPVCAR
jgi:NADPH-dependent curcumin reductase CurA